MARLIAKLYGLGDNCMVAENILSFELSRDIDAACDGLRLHLCMEDLLEEIYRVEMFCDDKIIFNGYVDTQRESVSKSGYRCFIYSRSSACLLTDNACVPTTYFKPDVKALFYANAENLGFVNKIGDYCSKGIYQVPNGTSRFGAINDFVHSLTSCNIMVNPDNEIVLIKADKVVNIPCNIITKQRRIINRMKALSDIDYKISADTDYKYHLESRLMQERKIFRTRVRNMSNVEDWQRERFLKNYMKDSARDYQSLELTLDGFVDITLCNYVVVDCRVCDDLPWRVKSVTYTLNADGISSKLLLFRESDLEEMIYVD